MYASSRAARCGASTSRRKTREIRRAKLDELRGGTPQDNAAALRSVLAGAPGPFRDIVRLNAGAALIIAGRADQPARRCGPGG